jgi:hypothetical protein
MSQADTQRLDRLVGDGNGEAGIDLASLFRVILNQVQDSADGVDMAGLTAPVQGAVSNHARVEHWYREKLPGADPWKALIADALEQLESRRLLKQDGGRWHTRPDFTTGKRMTVVPARKGRHKSVGVILYAADDREARGVAEKQRMEITSLAASLREDGRGLRPLDQKHVAVLEQSMRDYGYRPEFPVLVDRRGRILDGRHRIAAARRAGVDMPSPRLVPIDSDEEAVGFALLVNLQRGWSTAETKRINADLQAAGLTMENFGSQLGMAAKRELIAAALREHPEASHREIARMLGMDGDAGRKAVDRECAREVGHMSHFECTHGRTGQGARNDLANGDSSRSRKPDSPELLERHEQIDETVGQLRDQGMMQKEIAATTGLPFNQVQDSYQRLEGEQRGKRMATSSGTAPRPTATAPASKRPKPSNLMQRIARLLTRWESEDDDPSELEELEALRREIDERIETLRR